MNCSEFLATALYPHTLTPDVPRDDYHVRSTSFYHHIGGFVREQCDKTLQKKILPPSSKEIFLIADFIRSAMKNCYKKILMQSLTTLLASPDEKSVSC